MKQRRMPTGPGVTTIPRSTVLQRLARSIVVKRFARLPYGTLKIIDPEGCWEFGVEIPGDGMAAVVYVYDWRFYTDLVLGGSLGAGKSYIQRTWDCSDLTTFMRLMLSNQHRLGNGERGCLLLHWLRRHTLDGSWRQMSAHYKLSKEFFALFLDETMTYSCGIFAHPTTSLYEASVAKNDLICRKLALQPDDHLLEIGGGWGSLALHAASCYGCRVTTTTMSQAQYNLTMERVQAAGLADKITVLLVDYRQLQGTYDKLVSVEMIETVGPQYFDTYFRTCSALLKPTGRMLLQTATIHEQQYEAARKAVDYIKYFIFPGACLPSISVMTSCVARVTDLCITDLNDIGQHYAITLGHWRERFLANKESCERLGYPETFQRMWEFYFCYCEAGFLERYRSAVQIVLAKPQYRAPLVIPRGMSPAALANPS